MIVNKAKSMFEKIVVILFVIGFILAGCESEPKIKTTDSDYDKEINYDTLRPDQILTNVKISMYDGSFKSADINADSIEKFFKVDSTYAWGLDVYLYIKNGPDKRSHLIADSGMIKENINYMIANGNVVAVSHNGTKLESEQLIWMGAENLIKTDSFFIIIDSTGDTTQGTGMETDPNLNRVRIKNVRGTAKNVDMTED
ncbi:MAG: LPS export ABC transporter periplasmic protein LptC [Candidatus Zixiibacteriota bacterium]